MVPPTQRVCLHPVIIKTSTGQAPVVPLKTCQPAARLLQPQRPGESHRLKGPEVWALARPDQPGLQVAWLSEPPATFCYVQHSLVSLQKSVLCLVSTPWGIRVADSMTVNDVTAFCPGVSLRPWKLGPSTFYVPRPCCYFSVLRLLSALGKPLPSVPRTFPKASPDSVGRCPTVLPPSLGPLVPH